MYTLHTAETGSKEEQLSGSTVSQITTDGQIVTNAAGKFNASKLSTGIIIGGYFIQGAETDFLEESIIRY